MRRSIPFLAGGASVAPLLISLPSFAQAVPQSTSGTVSQPIPIQTITASYVRTPITDTPANVSVVTSQQMQDAGTVTLAQALRNVAGIHVAQSGNPGGQASVFLDGSNSEDVQVLRDGIPINDPATPNGAFNFGGQSVADVSRIVVVRGPMSGLYGSGAIGGVINMISRQGHGAPHLDYEAAAGFPGQAQGHLVFSGKTGRFDYAITGALDEQAGFDSVARRLSVYRGIREPFRYKLGAINLGYTPVAGTRISLIVRAHQSGYTYPELGYPIFDSPYQNGYDSQTFLRFGVTSHLLERRLRTSLFVAHIQDDRRYLTLLDPADPNGFAENSGYRGDRTVLQWNNVLHLPDAGPLDRLAVVGGVEHIHDHAIENLNDSYFGAPYSASVDAGQNTTAIHVGLQGRIARRLSFMAAVRDDSVTSFASVVTGRGGIVFDLPALDTRLKASYGTGFLAPSLFDLYGIDSYGYQGNPNLQPERSRAWQVGFETSPPVFGKAGAATLKLFYFHNDIDNLIQFVETPGGGSTEANVAVAHIHGIEAELDVTPRPWLSARLDYSYTIARNGSFAPLLRRPQNSGGASLQVRPVPRLLIDTTIRYIGPFSDYLYGNNGYPTGIGLASPGTIADLSVSYRLSSRLTLFATGRNLTNSRFEPVNGLQIPGQNFLFGIRGRIGL